MKPFINKKVWAKKKSLKAPQNTQKVLGIQKNEKMKGKYEENNKNSWDAIETFTQDSNIATI